VIAALEAAHYAQLNSSLPARTEGSRLLELEERDPQISVFLLEADDWPTARAMRLRALADSPEAFLGDLSSESEHDEVHWRSELRLNAWLLATLEGTPVAVAKLNLVPEHNDGTHLEALWVAPEIRHLGVGEVLVSAVESTAKTLGVNVLRLWVFADNRSAQTFYRHLGYASSARRQKIEVNGQVRVEEEFEKRLE